MIKKIVNIVILLCLSIVIIAQTVEQDIYWKALNYLNNNNPDSALIVLNSKDNCYECNKLRADIYLDQNDVLNAINIYKKLTDNLDSESYFMLSVIYAGLGFADESVAYLEKYFEFKNPKFYSEILSYKEFEMINNTFAWKEFWNGTRYSKNELKLEEAEYFIKTENYNSALEILESINYSSKREYIYYLIATIYFNYENFSQASKYVDLSLKSNSNFIPALYLLRDIQSIYQTFELAKQTNERLMNLDPYNQDIICKHAELLLNLDKPIEAEKYIDMYLKYFPDNESANYLKSLILIDGEDYRKALINLNILIEQNPSNSDYFVKRADIYYKLESWRFASNDYSMALDINPNLDQVWYLYGMCQFNLNDEKKACHAWQKSANMKNRKAAKMLYKYCK